MSLNTHSPVPLYQQLAERIRQAVALETYPVGAKIPSEHELAKQYAIGRPTVRQATDLLVREGVLKRKRGSGTYVLPSTQKIDLFSLTGTSAAFNQSELAADIEVLVPPMLLDHHAERPAVFVERAAYVFKRLSRIDRAPVLLEVIYLDAGLFNGIDKYTLNGDSLSRIVRDDYFLEASAADQSFTIIYPEHDVAALMQTDIRLPLLQVGRTLHFGDYQAAIYCDIYCRTDRFNFSQTLYT